MTARRSVDWASLVNRYFHTFCVGHRIEQQGVVLADLGDGYYMTQLYEWFSGSPSFTGTRVVHISTIAAEGWAWYETAEAWRDSYDHSGRAHRDHGCECDEPTRAQAA